VSSRWPAKRIDLSDARFWPYSSSVISTRPRHSGSLHSQRKGTGVVLGRGATAARSRSLAALFRFRASPVRPPFRLSRASGVSGLVNCKHRALGEAHVVVAALVLMARERNGNPAFALADLLSRRGSSVPARYLWHGRERRRT
jgi:hypothetical protein